MLEALRSSDMFKRIFDLKPVTIAILVILIAGTFAIRQLMKNKKTITFDTKMLVYASLCIALSFVLSYIRLYRLPQGGSITPASMLPMFMFAVIFGPIPGMIAGLALGMLRLIQDPYVVHWAQFFIDYPLANAALGLAGLYRKNLAVSCVIGGFSRFIMAFLSGILFFASYTPEGMNVLYYSLTYNGAVVGANTLICIIISALPQVQSAIKQIQMGVAHSR